MKKLIFLIFIIHFSLIISNAQWVQVSNGVGTNYSLTSNSNNIFAGTSGYGVYISSNNGSNWTQNGLEYRTVKVLETVGNNIFAGTDYNGVYLSTNNGMNWTQTSLINQYVFSLAISGNKIFAGTTYNGVYLSTDNGSSWVQTTLNNITINSLAISGNNIFAGTNTNSQGVYLSTNNGANWNQTALNNETVPSLAISGNNIYAGTYQSGIYLSTNNGANWTQIGLNNLSANTIAINGNYIFVGTQNNGIYISSNNGLSWVSKNQGFSVIPIIIKLLVANNYIFAATGSYSVWCRSLSEITGVQNISSNIPDKFSLYQNYPNPFNPSTNIRYEIPKNGFVKLVVFDELGREIETLVNEQLAPGTYSVDWNASAFPSGVYFYRLSSGDFSETKRMTLIK